MAEAHVEVEADSQKRVESAPGVPQPERGDEREEARGRLHQLARRLARGREGRLMVEYLRLRRSLK